MKKLVLAVLLISLQHGAHAQAGAWTWMKGCNFTGCSGTWGTQGIPAPANTPEGVYAPYYWIDAQKNLWIYSGLGATGVYSALWKFNPVQNEWTWIQGSNFSYQAPVYGSQGIFASSNSPGYRDFGSVSWTDNNGKFWLYGGDASYGTMSDLWEYDPTLNQWAWIAGSNTGNASAVYGTKGIPASSNTPGARREGNATWVDLSGNLWMFGGETSGSFHNDMWKFDVSLNQWAWMAGTTSVNGAGTYGTLGVADSNNTPGGRSAYCKWQDKLGKFWLFGGGNWNSNLYYNDLWMFDPVTNYWTWMSGTSNQNTAANAGAKCDSSASYYPASRFENRACAVDSCGNFWLFGGAFQTDNSETINDLWVYRPSHNDWTLVSGELTYNNSGMYGTLGVPDTNNLPGSRIGSIMWIDLQGNVWLFGGSGSWFLTYFNDVWKFTPDPNCPVIGNCLSSSIAFNASDKNICEKFCINFYDSSANNPISWQWIFQGGAPSSSTAQNPANICYDVPGTYDVTLITTNANGTDSLTLHNYVTVYATPPFPVIVQVGYTLTSSPASSYQWQLNAVDIPGATNQSYTVLQTGYYSVIISDANGCKNSVTKFMQITGIGDVLSDANIFIYPTPSSGSFTVEFPDAGTPGDVSIEVVNMLGQKVFSSRQKINSTDWKKEIDLGDGPAGVYFLNIKTQKNFLQKKIIIEK